MICNVCGADARCFTLTECEFPHNRRFGMVFRICSSCLEKLVAGIATPQTSLEKAEDFELPSHVESRKRRDDEIRKNFALTPKPPTRASASPASQSVSPSKPATFIRR